MMDRIYLDHAATTPLRPEVRAAMEPWLGEGFGNPSSLHAEGRRARLAVDEARETLADAFRCSFGEVVFVASGTEALNHALWGAAWAASEGSRRRILLGAVEHPAVLENRPRLERLGYRVEPLPAERFGAYDISALERTLSDEVLLVAAMDANNELGTIQPSAEIGRLCRQAGALYLCDAVQSFGAPRATMEAIGCDLMAASAHKMGGPKGVGALGIRAGVSVAPLIVGGGQEREARAGTENVAAIVGFAAAVRSAAGDTSRLERRRQAADIFRSEITRQAGERVAFTIPDGGASVLPGHCHLRFPGISAESMLVRLDREGIAASSGAACSSGSLLPSHVLLACGYPESEAKEGLRFTFGGDESADAALEAARRVLAAAQAIRDSRRL